MAWKCKKAQAAYHKEWTAKNMDKRLAANKRWRKQEMDWFRDLKSKLKCEKCGENHPACLDFHHLDPNEKEGVIGMMAGKVSRKKILEEISKCIVVCANCHRKIHYTGD